MPADRFPFAVFIGREQELVALFQHFLELGDMALLLIRHDVNRFEILVDVDGEVGPGFVFKLLGNLFSTLG